MTNLSEILELNYAYRKDRTKKTDISEVYGIIYRIYCIPEEKSYIGQTFSHMICLEYLQRHGIISRCKIHYRAKDYDDHRNKPLYQALNKYSSDQFEVYEEKRLYKEEIGQINQVEAEYMEKYQSLYPNGYNIEEVGKKYTRLMKRLAEHYGFEMKRHDYVDKTRENRCKDVCFGVRFGLPRASYSKNLIRNKLKSIDIESVRLVKTANDLRIIVKEIGSKDNIRVYFKGSGEECLDFARELTENVEISENFRGTDCYKYQTKLEKALSLEGVLRITGKIYGNVSAGNQTYLLIFYGRKEGKIQSVSRISFGGKTLDISESKRDAMEFIDRFATATTSDLIFDLE
jgi:hypothetical protein